MDISEIMLTDGSVSHLLQAHLPAQQEAAAARQGSERLHHACLGRNISDHSVELGMQMNIDGFRGSISSQDLRPTAGHMHDDQEPNDHETGKEKGDGHMRLRLAEHAWRLLDFANDPNPRAGGRLGERRGRIVIAMLDCACRVAEKYSNAWPMYRGTDFIAKKSMGKDVRDQIEQKTNELRRNLPLMGCLNDISSTISALIAAVILGSSRELASLLGVRLQDQADAECQTDGQQQHYSALFNPLSGFTDKELIDELHRRASSSSSASASQTNSVPQRMQHSMPQLHGLPMASQFNLFPMPSHMNPVSIQTHGAPVSGLMPQI
jgi:hypothetical protein